MLKAVPGAVVVVTNTKYVVTKTTYAVTKTKHTVNSSQCTAKKGRAFARLNLFVLAAKIFSCFVIFSNSLFAAVLPEDRLDILYHAYDGGGAEISGPSILVRKGFADTISVYGNYYVDNVTSASIDVQATASPYTEKRNEYSVGFDYLHDKTIVSMGYTNSSESDYEAETTSFGISQDFFGDLTTISLGFSFGQDVVGRNEDLDPNDPTQVAFAEETERRRYSLGISQVITKNLIMSFGFETVADEGYLNNPYRSVRYLDPSTGAGYSYEPEVYPRTHNSDAFALRAMYYLPYRASVRAEYRTYSDNWGIESTMAELRYIHPLPKWRLTLEGKIRGYDQTGSTFFNDLFPYRNFTGEEFRARDKELSAFSDTGVGIGITYDFPNSWIPFFDRSAATLYWDFMSFEYSEFRDVTDPDAITPGTEELYSFDANVIRLFVSFWF